MNYKQLKKDWIEKGEIPEWYSTNSLKFFMNKYSYKGESVKSRDKAVAKYLADNAPSVYPDWWESDPYTKELTYEEVFFNAIYRDGYATPSTPLKANAGVKDRGTTVSCSRQFISNNIASKYLNNAETAIFTKLSHGCSVTIDDWLAEGDPIGEGDFSEGVVPIVDMIRKTTQEITHSTRRGSVAFYLGIDHGDFWKVAQMLYEDPDGLNVGWLIPDSFIDKLKAGDKDAIQRWNRVIYIRLAKGRGYLAMTDRMNRNKAQTFKNLNMYIKGSNLCVAPETKILTRNGYEIISELEGETVEVWNGDEWSETKVVKTGVNQKLLKVITSSNQEINCTEYHKFYVQTGFSGDEIVEKRAFELKSGDKLVKFDLPVVQNNGKLNTGLEKYEVEECSLTIKSVTDEGRYDDTYCVNEPKRHMVVFNGVLTGNCVELNLPANEEYSSTCVILNANLALYDEFPEHLFHILHIMQDCNVSGYLKQIEEMKPHTRKLMKKAYNFTKDFRAVGTGTLGLHSLFMKKRIVYGSFDSMLLNEQIYSRMQKDTNEANEWLAEVLGVPCGVAAAGLKLRNATTMFSPPTKSSTDLSRETPTEGINLETALIKVKESAGGEQFRINYEFLKLMKERGMYTPEEVARIAKNKGSCQDCDWLTQKEKDVFRIAFEIPMDAHIDLCSQRQKYFDQQQSINLYFSGSDSEEYIGEIHKKAVLDEWINSLYYCYSSRGGRYTRATECEMCN